MSYINSRKKAMMMLLCLISFTLGCIVTSQLGIKKIPERLQGARHRDWVKTMRRQGLRDWYANITLMHPPSGADRQNTHEAVFSDNNGLVANETEFLENYNYLTDETNVRDDHLIEPEEDMHPVNKPASQHNYFVEVEDPRAAYILQKVIGKLPNNLIKSVVMKNHILDDRSLLGKSKKSKMNVKKKWELLINSMRDLGYEQRLPTVINIGVKKSGTNAFGFFISQHPQIAHSIGNEVHYFDWNYDKGIEYYRSKMGFSRVDQLNFEKTPRYFVTEDAPKNILKDLPSSIKFVICIRDPVNRAISEFRHEAELKMRRGRKKDQLTVRAEAKSETTASQGELFEQTVLDKNGQVNASNDIVCTSIYSKHFKNWLKSFPRDRFYILSDEKVNEDIYTEMKNIEKFLGLKPFYERNMFYYNTDIHGYCMHGKPRQCPGKSTPGFLPKAKPSSEVIQKLRDFYRPFNQEFEQLAQIKFSWTNF